MRQAIGLDTMLTVALPPAPAARRRPSRTCCSTLKSRPPPHPEPAPEPAAAPAPEPGEANEVTVVGFSATDYAARFPSPAPARSHKPMLVAIGARS